MAHLEHIGIAVREAEAVRRLYHDLLGLVPYKTEAVAREGVQTHFLATDNVKLELLEALGPDSPVAKHLERRGEGLHHLAFEVDDLPATIARLTAAGYTPLSPEARPGADGKQIVFLHPKQTHGVLVEFCQSVPALPPTAVLKGAGEPLATYPFGEATAPALLCLSDAPPLTLEPLARLLAQTHHVVLVDALSSITAERAAALFDAIGGPAVLAFGAWAGVAVRYAAQRPGHLQRLILHAPPKNLDLPGSLPTLLITGDGDLPAVKATVDLHATHPRSALAVLPGAGPTPDGLDVHPYANLLRGWLMADA